MEECKSLDPVLKDHASLRLCAQGLVSAISTCGTLIDRW